MHWNGIKIHKYIICWKIYKDITFFKEVYLALLCVQFGFVFFIRYDKIIIKTLNLIKEALYGLAWFSRSREDSIMNLPDSFIKKMQHILGEEYEAYRKSYEQERLYGLRVNTNKISAEKFEKICPFSIKKIPWIPNGYYYDGALQPSKHPYYFAGLYYLQEPSAMTPASRLNVEPGDAVLDLCAAPGGKATELGAKLLGDGVLVANDISNSRAKALLKNIELLGISNTFVVNEIPSRLADEFTEFFDKILIDAPCSGEGMFRKDPAIIKSWEKNGPEFYAKLQREILMQAAKMLKPGGKLLYSTCTFSAEENEGSIQFLLDQEPDFTILPIEEYQGFATGRPDLIHGSPELEKTVRIWPHKMPGEGHFIALLQKKGECSKHSIVRRKNNLTKTQLALLQEFFIDITMELDWNRVEVRADRAYYMPGILPEKKGMRFLRNGLYLGELKKNRFEPSQPFAMALKSCEYASVVDFSSEDPRVIRYLKGETLNISDLLVKRNHGWQLVCVDGYPLGWAKITEGLLKNKYYAGWRWM